MFVVVVVVVIVVVKSVTVEQIGVHDSAFFQLSLLLHLPQRADLMFPVLLTLNLPKNGFSLYFTTFVSQISLFLGFQLPHNISADFSKFVMNYVPASS